jgi:uncharacterized membrane protein
MIKKYFKIWWVLTTRTTQLALVSRFGVAIFLLGKLLRFVFFLLFLFRRSFVFNFDGGDEFGDETPQVVSRRVGQ